MAFVYRPISSRPITFYNNNSFQRCTVVHQHELYWSGYRGLGLRSALAVYWYRCSHSSYHLSDTWGPSWAPPCSCGLVRRHRSPHNRMPRVPLALAVASYLSPPFAFTRLVPAPRTAASRGRAPSATRMRSAAQMARPLGAMHSRTVTDSGSQQGPSLLCSWNLLPCRSPP